MKIICYHGTDADTAQSILKIGFHPDSWFAAHLEDAIAYGGLHVFEVVFEDVRPPPWQFHVLAAVPLERIVGYNVFQFERIFDNKKLREEIFQEHPEVE